MELRQVRIGCILSGKEYKQPYKTQGFFSAAPSEDSGGPQKEETETAF